MEILLIVAIVVTVISIAVQAGALLAMYLVSRRVANNVNGLVSESHRVISPLESVASNLKSASDNVASMAQEQKQALHHLRSILSDTTSDIRADIHDFRDRIRETVDEIEARVMTPVHEWSAIAAGISAGIRTLLRRYPETVTDENRRTPAA